MNEPRPEIVRPYLNCAFEATSAIRIERSGLPRTTTLPSPSNSRSSRFASSSSAATSRIDSRASRAAAITALPDPVRRPAGERAHVVRPGVGVGGLDVDVVHAHAERLGADLADHRAEPLSQVRGRQRHDEAAVGGGVDERLRRVAAEVHAGGVVDGRHAGAAQLGHRQRASAACCRLAAAARAAASASRGADVIARRSAGSSWPTSSAAACIVSISVASSTTLRCGLMSPLR